MNGTVYEALQLQVICSILLLPPLSCALTFPQNLIFTQPQCTFFPYDEEPKFHTHTKQQVKLP